MRRTAFVPVLLLAAALAPIGRLAAQEPYRLPPKVVVDILDAPPPPATFVSPDRGWLLLADRAALPTIADLSQPMLRLAGSRINPATNGPFRAINFTGLRLERIADGQVRAVTGVDATLKWPNDVLAGDRKLAGILAEQSDDAVVVGVGVNVATPEELLPVSPGGLRATSLRVEGAEVARDVLLVEVLRQFERWYLALRADPDPLRTGLLAQYRTLCGTLGRQVRVELPGGRHLTGVAQDVDADGRLLIEEPEATSLTPVSAGDVIHVRLHRILDLSSFSVVIATLTRNKSAG